MKHSRHSWTSGTHSAATQSSCAQLVTAKTLGSADCELSTCKASPTDALCDFANIQFVGQLHGQSTFKRCDLIGLISYATVNTLHIAIWMT